MKIIAKPRKSGKTTELIKMSAKSGSYIVCFNHREAGMIFDQAKKEGMDINLPITYGDFIDKRYYGRGIKGFLIDDVGLFLQYFCRDVEIEAVTITTTEETVSEMPEDTIEPKKSSKGWWIRQEETKLKKGMDKDVKKLQDIVLKNQNNKPLLCSGGNHGT